MGSEAHATASMPRPSMTQDSYWCRFVYSEWGSDPDMRTHQRANSGLLRTILCGG
jgi:hypothetical protein